MGPHLLQMTHNICFPFLDTSLCHESYNHQVQLPHYVLGTDSIKSFQISNAGLEGCALAFVLRNLQTSLIVESLDYI